MYQKTHTDDLFAFSDVTVQPANTTCYYACCLDASGNGTIVNGDPVLTSVGGARMPEVSDSVCVIGAVEVRTASGTFTPGTSNVATAGAITVEFFNLSCVPTGAF
jgi:hypothetical protein